MRYNACMVVYVEYVIIDNFVLTYYIAVIAYRLLRLRPRRWRAAAAALIGTGAALAYPLLDAVWAVWLMRLALAVALSAVLFVPGHAVRGGLYFLLSTAVFGGALFFLGYLLTGSAAAATLQPLSVPVAVPVLAGAVLYRAVRRAFTAVRRRTAAETIRLKVERRGKSVVCDGLLDTGNGVFDEHTGLPVVVLTARTTVRLLSDEEFAAFAFGGKGAPPGRWIGVSGAGGTQKILLVQDVRIALYTGRDRNILNDVAAGLSLIRSPYGAIVGPAVLRESEPQFGRPAER